MENFAKAVSDFASFVWDWPLIILLFGTHLFLTVRTGFIQRHLGHAIRISFSRKQEGEGDISQFGALMTALAATIGTGNIIGVASAVAAGGPGAVFWMWMTGVFGIATKYAEAVLSVKYRIHLLDGTMAGGPMYVLERGLGQKWLGILFAIFTCIAAFGIGCMTQANSVVENLHGAMGGHETTFRWIVGLIMASLTAAVILGGVKSIARVCSYLVPIMALLYLAGCGLILIKNYAEIPASFSLIVTSAFSGKAAVGGLVGVGMREVVRQGIARGLFSNESGLGSAPIVAAAARTKNPVHQALVSATGTFWDTVVICLITGLVVVSSGHWHEGLDKVHLTQAAFADLHYLGPWILLIGLVTFVFSTILGWSYYGEKAAEYLFGERIVLPYRLLWVGAVLAGSLLKASLVWDLSDIANAFMAVPNLIALLGLSGVVAAETKKFREELTGRDP